MMIITISQVVTNKTKVVLTMVIQWTIMEVTMVNIMTLIQAISTLLIIIDQDMGSMNNRMKHSVMITIILDMMYKAMDPDVKMFMMYPLSSIPHPFRQSFDSDRDKMYMGMDPDISKVMMYQLSSIPLPIM